MKTLNEIGIKSTHPTFIIAEIGINHGGDLDVAKRLIDSALRAGADAVKFQTYLTEKRVAKESPIFEILKKCELPFDAFLELKLHAETQNGTFFSTPFDIESLDYLESIDVTMHKLASFDVTNKLFLDQVGKTKKPLILSVGMSNIVEIDTALQIITKYHSNVALLHCISAYPTLESHANLAAIHTLRLKYPQLVIGQSDHTSGIQVPLYAVAAGAQVLEKHFKISDTMDCIDAPVSISEEQMKELVQKVRHLEQMMGDGVPRLTEAQKGIEQYRRRS